MGDELRVDADALNSAGAAYGEAASALSALDPDGPLTTAANGVPGLQTASACRAAATALAQQKATAASDVSTFSTDLGAAAAKYRDTDGNAADAVAATMPGG